MTIERIPLAVRFEKYVIPEPNSGCHLWLGAVNESGYGKIDSGGRRGRTLKAHVVAYELAKGPVPPGLELDHLCRVPCCVNPDHLEPVTRRENTIRGDCPEVTRKRFAARLYCVNGHELKAENVRVERAGAYFRRRCRKCESSRYERKRASQGLKDRARDR
jgi:hypothetical protein